MCDGNCADCPGDDGAADVEATDDAATADGLMADGGVATDADAAGGSASATFDVAIDLDGEVTTVECGADQPILEAAEDAGMELPHSCRGGSCTECVARLEEGDVDQSRAMGIDPMQKDDGYLLPCVATPNEDCRIVADVQDELFDLDI